MAGPLPVVHDVLEEDLLLDLLCDVGLYLGLVSSLQFVYQVLLVVCLQADVQLLENVTRFSTMTTSCTQTPLLNVITISPEIPKQICFTQIGTRSI